MQNRNAAMLVINLSPPWRDTAVYEHWKMSVTELPEYWESPPGLALCPFDLLFVVCAQMHQHLTRSRSNTVVSTALV
jgi:hypothetical protein